MRTRKNVVVCILFSCLLVAVTLVSGDSEAMVPQDIGIYDTLIDEYSAETCRGCHGNTAAVASRHHSAVTALPSCPDSSSDCTVCHTDLLDYSNITPDCLECHDQAHHTSDLSGSGQCTACHQPDMVAAIRSVKTSSFYPTATTYTPTPFNCVTCHTETESQPGVPMNIYSNMATHHMSFQGNVAAACYDCHSNDPYDPNWNPGSPLLIRYCENCHSKDSLHSIKAHVTEGQGYSAEEKCVACHGAVPVSNLIPFLNQLAATPPSVIAMTPIYGAAGTTCTITGQSFDKKGDILMTARTGQTDQTHSISWQDCTWENDAIEFTIPSGLTPGNYNVRVETKNGLSNMRVYTVTGTPAIPCPDTVPSIDSIKATVGVAPLIVTIDGDNFGDRHTSGRNVYMQEEGYSDRELFIYSWTDKRIQAYVPAWTFNLGSHAIKVETEIGVSNTIDFTLRKYPDLNVINYDPVTRILTLSGFGFGEYQQYTRTDGFGWASQIKLATKKRLGISPDTVFPITEDNIEAWSDMEIRLTLPIEIPIGIYGVTVETVYFFDTNSNNAYGQGDQKYQTVNSDPQMLELL